MSPAQPSALGRSSGTAVVRPSVQNVADQFGRLALPQKSGGCWDEHRVPRGCSMKDDAGGVGYHEHTEREVPRPNEAVSLLRCTRAIGVRHPYPSCMDTE
jgi:hypothetical protein